MLEVGRVGVPAGVATGTEEGLDSVRFWEWRTKGAAGGVYPSEGYCLVMAESARTLPPTAGAVSYERPLDEAVPATAWRKILSGDEPVDLETSSVELVRAIRDLTGA